MHSDQQIERDRSNKKKTQLWFSSFKPKKGWWRRRWLLPLFSINFSSSSSSSLSPLFLLSLPLYLLLQPFLLPSKSFRRRSLLSSLPQETLYLPAPAPVQSLLLKALLIPTLATAPRTLTRLLLPSLLRRFLLLLHRLILPPELYSSFSLSHPPRYGSVAL